MSRNYCVYIVIAAWFLMAFSDIRVVAEETLSPSEKAIELAKTCVIHVEGKEMSVEEAISALKELPGFSPVDWQAIDVSNGEYFVVFKYTQYNINQLLAFHVVLYNSVEKIEIGSDGLEGNRYVSRILSTSTYTKDVLQKKIKDVLEQLLFQ